MIAGTAAASWQAVRAGREARSAAAVNEVLLQVLGAADPYKSGKSSGGVDLLDRAAAVIQEQFQGQPQREIAARITIGKAYEFNHQYAKAEEQLRAAWMLQRQLAGDAHPDTLRTLDLFGCIVQERGRLEEARQLLHTALDGRERLLGPRHRETNISRMHLARVYRSLRQGDTGEALARTAFEGLRALAGADDPDTILAEAELSQQIYWNGRQAEAAEMNAGIVERARQVFGPRHIATLRIMANWGATLQLPGRMDEAERVILETLAGFRSVYGEEHSDAMFVLEVLATIRWSQGRLRESEETLRRALEIRLRVNGPAHMRTLMTMGQLGQLLRWRGALAESIQLARAAHQGLVQSVGVVHSTTLWRQAELALLLAEHDAAAAHEAEALARDTLARIASIYRPEEPIFMATQALAASLRTQGRVDDAMAIVGRTLADVDLCSRWPGHAGVLRAIGAGCLVDQGGRDAAESQLLAAWAEISEGLPFKFPQVLSILRDLANFADGRGAVAAAAQWRQELEYLNTHIE